MIEIRRVDSHEWETVRAVRLAALKDAPDWFWVTYDEERDKPERWWRDFIDGGAWFVAYEETQPLGIAAGIRDPELDACTRQLISMWVAPDARDRGIGVQLVETVKAWAREDGATELQLQVTEGNERAVRLYERCGFRTTGSSTPLPRNPRLIEREMRVRL